MTSPRSIWRLMTTQTERHNQIYWKGGGGGILEKLARKRNLCSNIRFYDNAFLINLNQNCQRRKVVRGGGGGGGWR